MKNNISFEDVLLFIAVPLLLTLLQVPSEAYVKIDKWIVGGLFILLLWYVIKFFKALYQIIGPII